MMTATKKILVADDDRQLLTLIEACFRDSAYEISTVTNGKDALTLAREHRPNLLILDVLMPGLSGLDVEKQLRSQPETADMPILFLTGLVPQSEEKDIYTNGKQATLAKPFDPEKLLSAVEKLIK